MSIPKIIHFTWIGGDIPLYMKPIQQTWLTNHPDWEVRLWTDEQSVAFIADHYPDFLPHFRAFPLDIMRADAIRCFVLYHFGGVYADLDMRSLRSIEPLLDGHSCVLGYERDQQAVQNGPPLISNAIMACAPGHSFMHKVCQQLYSWELVKETSNLIVLSTTGPVMVTKCYQDYEHKESVKIYESDILVPLSMAEMALLCLGKMERHSLFKKLENSYTLHYYWGSWWQSEPALAMKIKAFENIEKKYFSVDE